MGCVTFWSPCILTVAMVMLLKEEYYVQLL
jgi:hypothetical protein